MSYNKQHLVDELETIIRLLADVWPADRENLPQAGAKFEQVIEKFEKNYVQLKKLVDLSWQGLMHLYQKEEYFMMVKAATMQSTNTIREYILQDGNINVGTFEKAYDELEKALEGGAESADTVIELDEVSSAEEKTDEVPAGAEEKSDEDQVTLDDLASFFMTLDEEFISENQLDKLSSLLRQLSVTLTEPVAQPLKEAIAIVEDRLNNTAEEGWLLIVSEKTEKAIEVLNKAEWDDWQGESDIQKAEVAPVNHEQVFIIPADIEISMVGEFVTECAELIELAESALLDLEESPGDEELINTIFRAFHTIKGTSAFMGLEPITEFTHSVETFLSLVREGEVDFDTACADISLKSIDIINKMLAVVENAKGGDPLPKPPHFSIMLQVLEDISDNNITPNKALETKEDDFNTKSASEAKKSEAGAPSILNSGLENVGGENTEEEKAAKKSGKSDAESSIRVNMNRLDRLIDMVGELVIAHSVVAQDKSISKYSELQKKVNHASKILRELQDTSLTLRMVPLKATFQKMNRLVRDLSRKAGKKVKITTSGDETEIDRNMVDIINEPLIHMIRNSLDHGVEAPQERTQAGKEETAHIQLSASQEGGKVVIKIEDDGRGINKEKILKKAIEKGLVETDNTLTEKEIYNLIFLPGFSSAEKITDLSGRGVGMDVVRRSIEKLQGKVNVSSELGKGTVISIELPFTLAITDGMVVRVGQDRFIIPTINIDLTFRAEKNDVFTVLGNQEQVAYRGHSVPVLRLHRLFDIKDAEEDLANGTLMVIKNNNKKYALLVDEVIGQQQLVGKSIKIMAKMDHISGGAIMGDGKVGLILDTAALTNWSSRASYT